MNKRDVEMNDTGVNDQNMDIHDILMEVVNSDPSELQRLAYELDLNVNEMEQEARLRLEEEAEATQMVKDDEESIKLMKQTLFLERILEAFGDNSS